MPNISMNKDAHKLAPVMLAVEPSAFEETRAWAPLCQGVTPFLVLRTITCSTLLLNILKYRSF